MDRTEHLLLVNAETKEEHQLQNAECVIGRGWLKCVDCRISRKHGILKLTSNDSISLTSTHVNPIFYKTKTEGTLQMINKDNGSIVLSAGDSFGLFPDAFWFDIVKSNMQSGNQESADGSSVFKATPSKPPAATEVSKRKLPAWMVNGNSSKKMRSDDIGATATNNNDDMAATEIYNSTEVYNKATTSVVKQKGPESMPEAPSMEPAAEETASKRIEPAIEEEANENGTDEATASKGENNVEMEEPVTPDMEFGVPEEEELPSIPNGNEKTQVDGNQEAAVSNEPIVDTNVPKSDEDAGHIQNENQDLPTGNPHDQNDASDAALAEPATSGTGVQPTESDDESIDGVPMPNIVQIKTEPNDDIEPNVTDDPAVAGPSAAVAVPSGAVTIKQEIKTEVKTEPDSSTDSKVPARDCCPYGIRCYRRNPGHRAEMAHPGDIDYRLPSYGDPLPGATPCPFGLRCYRRNPTHFRQFSHPPSTDPAANRKALRAKKVQNSKRNNDKMDDDYDDDSDDNDEDPFADDGDADDPDFLGDDDLSDDTEDYESEKDSGHDTEKSSTEAD